MLRVEDCKPGVEVIAIKNGKDQVIKPYLIIGQIYTISQLDLTMTFWNSDRILHIPNICLHEIDNSLARTGGGWGYFLWQFKLRDLKMFKESFLTRNLNAEGPLRKVKEEV